MAILQLYIRAVQKSSKQYFLGLVLQESDINAWNFTATIWGRNIMGTTNIEHVKMAQTCWIHKSFLLENLLEGYHFHIKIHTLNSLLCHKNDDILHHKLDGTFGLVATLAALFATFFSAMFRVNMAHKIIVTILFHPSAKYENVPLYFCQFGKPCA